MPDVPHDAESNGQAQLSPSDDAIIAPLKARVDELRTKRDDLETQRAEITQQINEVATEARKYEKAMLVIAGEPLRKPSELIEEEEEAPTKRKREKPSGVGPEKLRRIEAAVREVAAEQDDITQVAVRTRTGDASGTTALAFETLRGEGVIRLAGKRGNLKIYRLTAAALRDEAPELA